MIDVTVLLLSKGLPSTAIAPMEVFRCAGVGWNFVNGERGAPLFRVRTASIDGQPVQYEGLLRITPESSLDDIRQADSIVVSSTGLETEQLLARHGKVVPWLQRLHRRGASIAGICSGVALLAEAGLLDGRPATTHWALADLYRTKYPRVDWHPELFITEADDIYCGGGVYAALELSLYLVEKYAGHDVAVKCGKTLLIDMPRAWQSSFAAPPRRPGHRDEQIRAVQDWLHRAFAKPLRVNDVAKEAGMSPRNFVRRFKRAIGEAPSTYLQKLRIEVGKHLLEQDYRTVDEVARAVGYEDVASFRAGFKRYTRISPQDYRRQFASLTTPQVRVPTGIRDANAASASLRREPRADAVRDGMVSRTRRARSWPCLRLFGGAPYDFLHIDEAALDA